MRAHTFLYETIDPTREDLASVAQWLRAEPDQIEVHIKHEPIDKFLGQIKEMYGTFSEFPKDERRTNKILRLLKQGATPMPMYVEQGDKDLFVMEGRHRMVAFWLAGMKTVPVAYASKKLDETINPEILDRVELKHELTIGDFKYTAEWGRGRLTIVCNHLSGRMAGCADFKVYSTRMKADTNWLESQDTWVNPKDRKQGIASSMYAYAKMLGNDIKPSHAQTNMGKSMWNHWRTSGDDKHLVAETINPDILNPEFFHAQEIGDYTYKASVEIFMDEPLLNIKAYDGNKEIGHILFQIFDWEDDTNDGYMESGGTDVDPKYRNKGVASTMYAYAKMLGNDIRPSFQRTTAGRGMWDAWKKSGEAQHLVAEDSYQPPTLHTGDKILKGKFKNSPAEIKGFKKDKHNQPVLKTNKGDIQLFKPRVTKLMPKKLDEYEGSVTPTENSKEIFSKLQQLGYTKLGSGADATVWAKDSDHVIKILMPRRTLPSEVANAERGFLEFYNFCKDHSDVPNLPRFIDIGGEHHTVFDINGTPYRQIAMERLQHIPRRSFEEAMVWMLSDLAKNNASWGSVVRQLRNPRTWSGSSGMTKISDQVAEKFADPAVSKQYGILYLTMSRLYHSGLRSGLGWDLHTDNVMMRRDGTLVIVDPYFT